MSEKLQAIIDGKQRGFRSKAPDDETLLTEYADKTAKEIGAKYGVAESTARGWITQARKRLRKELQA